MADENAHRSRRRRRLIAHAISVFALCYFVWTLLTWTVTLENLTVGAAVSALITAAMLPLLVDTGTIRVTPRGIAKAVMLGALVAKNIVVANVVLARRIWSPSRPIRTGMVVVPTKVRSDAGLCAVGVITSLIVDNQIIDVDRARHTMLYHAIVVPEGDAAYDQVNGPVDQRVAALERIDGRRDD